MGKCSVAVGVVLCGACGAKAPAPSTVNQAATTPPAPTVGIAVVFETQMVWLGNDAWWHGSERGKYAGYYHQLEDALDVLAKQGPPGASIALVPYGDDARVVWTGPIEELTGDKIGPQETLSTFTQDDGAVVGQMGQAVSCGVDVAHVALASMHVDHPHLLLIGDGVRNMGGDLSPDPTATAIYLEGPHDLVPGTPDGWDTFSDDVWDADSGDNLAGTVGEIVARWR